MSPEQMKIKQQQCLETKKKTTSYQQKASTVGQTSCAGERDGCRTGERDGDMLTSLKGLPGYFALKQLKRKYERMMDRQSWQPDDDEDCAGI